MDLRKPMVITISRQMASGGAYIGHLLARKLGYQYVEREVLVRAAKELDVDIREVSTQDEASESFAQSLIKSFRFGTPEAYVPPSRRPVYDRELFEMESRILKAVAEQRNAVIVGRGGYSILRDRPNTLHVFVHAPLTFRIRRLRSFHQLSDKQAREEIEESDRKREKFLRMMTHTDRYDARNYHLALDSETCGFETAQKMILEALEVIKGKL